MSEKTVQLNEEVINSQIKKLVRGCVEETLNELLEAEAEKLTQAARFKSGYREGTIICTLGYPYHIEVQKVEAEKYYVANPTTLTQAF